MVSKEQIIEEIKRIAVTLGGKITEKDFQARSTIPLTTLRFHLGSWQRALKEAGLSSVGKIQETKPKNDDELLLDLIRLNEDSGEVPTPALIERKGLFNTRHYKERWKSIAEAFIQARKKFPEKFKPPLKINHTTENKKTDIKKTETKQRDKKEQVEKLELLKPIKKKDEMGPLEKAIEEEFPGQFVSEGTEIEGEHEMSHNHHGIKGEAIKFIPQTIKPQKAKVKPRVSLEPIDFRGFRYAPITKSGVTFLFGMISNELGFLIESFRSEFPDCEGKRCVDQEENQWEQIRIQLEYTSSDFKTHADSGKYDEGLCDLIVCWNHDWEDSPIEVLELRSILKYLE